MKSGSSARARWVSTHRVPYKLPQVLVHRVRGRAAARLAPLQCAERAVDEAAVLSAPVGVIFMHASPLLLVVVLAAVSVLCFPRARPRILDRNVRDDEARRFEDVGERGLDIPIPAVGEESIEREQLELHRQSHVSAVIWSFARMLRKICVRARVLWATMWQCAVTLPATSD